MRKILALLLSVLLLCAPALGMAESLTITPTFDGVDYVFGDFGFKITIPAGWIIEDEDEEYFFITYDEETGEWMEIVIAETGGASIMEIAEHLADEEGWELASVTINDIDFILFEAAVEAEFGAFAYGPEEGLYTWFIFGPLGDDAFADLALAIVGSIQNV